MESAITIWVDESTEIKIDGINYNLVGYLITNSDKEEFDFINELKQARKLTPSCWVTLHGNELKAADTRTLTLLNRWLKLFKENGSVYFHAFLYKRNEKFIPKDQTYEHYFAKQSVFALANKMCKKDSHVIRNMFRDVSTLTVLFDRRRSHSADIVTKGKDTQIERFHDLETIYREEIGKQVSKISEKDIKSNELTIRFSFLSSECFDAMQFSDCLLYLIRQKIGQESGGVENAYTKLFDKYFLDDLSSHTRSLGFRKIYEFDKKFNFFESTA